MLDKDRSHEEIDDPLRLDRRNFYKVGKWSRDWREWRNFCSRSDRGRG
jgi:hypothetical protein